MPGSGTFTLEYASREIAIKRQETKRMKSTPPTVTAELKRTIHNDVARALAEDNCQRDLSSAGLESKSGRAIVASRDAGVLAGCAWFDEVYKQLDRQVSIDWHQHDGRRIQAGHHLCSLTGPLRSLLQGERCALNFLQFLSGVASQTALYVERAKSNMVIKDTRKTVPGLRQAQKYAVRCGGGTNHRFSLADAIIIKENNIAAYGGIRRAVEGARQRQPGKSVEVEVENLQQLTEALAAKADTIMLDNFSAQEAQVAAEIIGERANIEVSGGITLENVRDYAALHVDCLSIGALTKNVSSLDFSMRVEGGA